MSHQFIFELDEYNKRPAIYKHRFLRQMKEYDPEEDGILSFLSREDNDPVHINYPVPIGKLMEIVEYLLGTWEAKQG